MPTEISNELPCRSWTRSMAQVDRCWRNGRRGEVSLGVQPELKQTPRVTDDRISMRVARVASVYCRMKTPAPAIFRPQFCDSRCIPKNGDKIGLPRNGRVWRDENEFVSHCPNPPFNCYHCDGLSKRRQFVHCRE